MIPTYHAKERWAERFPGLDMATTYLRARARVGRKTRKAIREACPVHSGLLTGTFQGIYYLITTDDIVFVMTQPEKVITVFQLAR